MPCPTRFVHHVLSLASLLVALLVEPASAQTNAPIPEVLVPVHVDSGQVQNKGKERAVIYSTVIQSAGAPWIQLKFDKAFLGRTPRGGQSTVLRMTSLSDAAVQNMKNNHLGQWQYTSAYFNGDAVRVEIIADPDVPPSQITINMIWAGVIEEGGIATICGTDNRVLSTDPRSARILPIGCTGWLANDDGHCMLTAGHCAGGVNTIEFNVPLSTPSGGLQHPPPADQYAADPASKQSTNGGLGNDWCYYGCFANSETGKTPFEAQQDAYVLAAAAPAVAGQTIRITGYGTDTSPPQNNQVQQTSTGPYIQISGLVLSYQVDTTGGNSGSAVQNESNSTAIGIHTNGGCSSGGGGTNKGTAINNSGLQNALNNPDGICIPVPSLTFTFPDGVPSKLDPSGDSIRVEVSGSGGAQPVEGSGTVYYDIGGGYISAPMNVVSPNVYDAIFPAVTCGTNVNFYFSAQTAKGETIFNPELAPFDVYNAVAALGVQTMYSTNFNIASDWTVSNDPSLTSGAWKQAAPSGNGTQHDPPTDADGSGYCFVTQNVNGYDVDGGSTTLTSPVLDASGQVTSISYERWFASSSPDSDSMLVEVSDDNGTSWVTLETITGGGQDAWVNQQWIVGDIPGINPSAQFRIRFTVTDVAPDSTVEGGLDDVVVKKLDCPSACSADIVATGNVDVDDLLAVINSWGPCRACSADIAPTGGNGIVNVDDLLAVINGWGPCP